MWLAEEMGATGSATVSNTEAHQGADTPAAAVLGYQDTRVGRLPIGPAADAALAAAASNGAAPRRERRSAEVLDLGAASRGAVLKRVAPAGAAALIAITAIVVWRKSKS